MYVKTALMKHWSHGISINSGVLLFRLQVTRPFVILKSKEHAITIRFVMGKMLGVLIMWQKRMARHVVILESV